jgi:hypothetical protein
MADKKTIEPENLQDDDIIGIRQWCVESALTAAGEGPNDVDDIIEEAEKIEAYILGKKNDDDA